MKIHLVVQRIVICMTTVVLALGTSIFVQNGIFNPSTLQSIPLQLAFGGVIFLWGMLCVPQIRYESIVAPSTHRHIIAQSVLGTVGAWSIVLATQSVMQAPLIVWLVPGALIPLIPFVIGACVILLAGLGICRAVVNAPGQDEQAYVAVLRKVHGYAGQFAATVAATLSIAILTSVFIAGRPTTETTITYTAFLFGVAIMLAWPKIKIRALKCPDRLWHIFPQIILMAAAIYAISQITRAYGFHSQLFEGQAAIDAAYPILENLFMLPFIVFRMTGSALALPRIIKKPQEPIPTPAFA